MNKNEKKTALDNALAGLKKLVFGAEAKADVIKTKIKYKFEIVEDSEGKTLQYPALEVGAPVTVGDSEGGEVAADGHYQIDEVTSITVKDGVIESIDAPEVEAELESEEGADAEVAEQVIEVVEAVQEQIGALEEEVKVLTDAIAEFSKMDKNVKALTDAVAKFSQQPVATSVTKQDVIAKDKTAQLADFLASKRKELNKRAK